MADLPFRSLCLQGPKLFFTDGKSRIDYVLVWCLKCAENDKKEELRTNVRSTFEENLREEGLELEHDIQVWIA